MRPKRCPIVWKPVHPRSGFLLLFAALFLISLGACQTEGRTWQRVQESGVLRIGLDPTYPPFENADGGELQGFDVDLAQALAAEMGVEANFVYFGYDGLYDALATEQVDILLSALVVQPERTRDFAYSDPYFDAGLRLVVPAGAAINSMEDLSGQSVAVELGAEGHVLATEWARRLPELEIIPHNSPVEALGAVVSGQADAAIIDSISAYTHPDQSLQVIPEPLTVEPFAVAVRIEDKKLLREINQALSILVDTGGLADIRREWFVE